MWCLGFFKKASCDELQSLHGWLLETASLGHFRWVVTVIGAL